ncbi:MAG TPA: hypothetical protein ENN43_07950 [bacterium]|nr:hypothetical protein [bacterium]
MKNRIFLIIAGLTAFRLIYINFLPLFGDEAYYWQWARNPAPGYYEQGPVLAVVIWIFTLFTQISNLFTLRLGAVILSAATMIVSILIIKKLSPENRQTPALWFLLLINTSLIYSIGSVMMMHDTVMVFFYSLFIFLMLRITEKKETPASPASWAAAGAALALGVMSKYTLLLLYPAAALYFILSRRFRENLAGFAVFTAVFTLSLSPVIYWNIINDFATLKYLLVRSGSGGFTLKYAVELLGSQIFLIGPAVLFASAPVFMRHIKKDFSSPFFMLSLFFAAAFLPFLLLSFKSRIEANWPAFAFLPLFYLAASGIPKMKPGFRKLVLSSALILGLFPAVFIHIQAVYPVFPLPEKMNPLRKSAGYKEAALLLDKNMKKYASKGPLFASSRHYQTASGIAFYSLPKHKIHIFIPHESSKNYRFWNNFDKMKGRNSVFIYEKYWEFADASVFFEKSSIVDKIEIYKDGKTARTFYAGFLENFMPEKGSF